MNVNDVSTKDIEIPTDDQVLPAIFGHQYELYLKYKDIERKNGFYKPDFELDTTLGVRKAVPNIDDAHYQHWLKDMFWRVTEEIAEAFEPVAKYTMIPQDWASKWDKDPNIQHFYEEIADATHFFVEASLPLIEPAMAELNFKTGIDSFIENYGYTPSMKLKAFEFISAMGLAANCLKNKPWKTTQMPTDLGRLNYCVDKAWITFGAFIKSISCTHASLYTLYFKKNQVNQFRQRSNY
jgi:hypothetical protein